MLEREWIERCPRCCERTPHRAAVGVLGSIVGCALRRPRGCVRCATRPAADAAERHGTTTFAWGHTWHTFRRRAR